MKRPLPKSVTIRLDSRKGNPIDNGQDHDLTLLDWESARLAAKRFVTGPQAQIVNKPCPIYNCHGLTFGSRRTQITPTGGEFFKLLQDDDYAQVVFDEVQTGDIILYIEPDDLSISHSGIVVRVEDGFGKKVPFVWSKWGKAQEVVHHFAHCPYDSSQVQVFRLKEWRK